MRHQDDQRNTVVKLTSFDGILHCVVLHDGVLHDGQSVQCPPLCHNSKTVEIAATESANLLNHFV